MCSCSARAGVEHFRVLEYVGKQQLVYDGLVDQNILAVLAVLAVAPDS